MHPSAAPRANPVVSTYGRFLPLTTIAVVLLALAPAAPAGDTSDTLPELNKKVKQYVDARVGKPRIGPNKECFDLADLALKSAGARTASHYGKVVKEADYVWGKLTDLKDVLSGDILQLRDYQATIARDYKLVAGQSINGMMFAGWKLVEVVKHEHHTSIVTAKEGTAKLLVVEQKVTDPETGKLSEMVRKNVLYVTDAQFTQGPETITVKDNQGKEVQLRTESGTIDVTVKGTIWVYRPQPLKQ
jgi:hypothetical protein